VESDLKAAQGHAQALEFSRNLWRAIGIGGGAATVIAIVIALVK
jgi:anti-sigma-K factor RskA